MLVLAMEFSRSTGRGATQQERSDVHERAVGTLRRRMRAPTSPKEWAEPERPRGRSLKTEQRCPPALAAPHGRPMVCNREMLGRPNSQ